MDTRVAGHRPAPVYRALTGRSTAGDLGEDKGISRGQIGPLEAGSFAVQKFFPLETFFGFSNFSDNRKGGSWRPIMMTGELFAVAILLSILFALAAHWQNDNDGGLL